MAPQHRVFLDASALIAGVISPSGGAGTIVALAAAGRVRVVISRQVQVECERAFQHKAPDLLPLYWQIIQEIQPEIIPAPTLDAIGQAEEMIVARDAPILAAAIASRPDYAVSLDRKHFLAPGVAERSGLRIGTPGDFLVWFRSQIERL